MPKVIKCKTCKKEIKRFKRPVSKETILKAIRRHYKKYHPEKFKQFAKKAVKTKREKGIINKRGRKMVKKKKWGKIGSPKSAKRKRWLAKLRRKKR